MKRKLVALLLTALFLCSLFGGCTKAQTTPAAANAPAEAAPAAQDAKAEPAVSDEPVTLTVAGGWPDCRALDAVAAEFTKLYPNCTITYEYLQDYYPSLEKRMNGSEPVDLFFSSNIQQDSPILPYALELNGCEGLDLSNTFDGLIQNFALRGASSGKTELYAIPLGAEMRGMYVNTTLLDSLGIAVPTDQASLLAACRTLMDNGYIPFHGNPGNFAQTLIYPWICNLIANADDPAAAHAKVDAHEPGLSEMFREPLAFLYSLVENGYYDYKKAQTDLNLFTETTDEDYARYFLSIRQDGDAWKKADDLGQVAFMPSPMSLESVIAKTKDDYHSEIEYTFIPSPVGKDGGFVYLSPAHGIAVNKDSAQIEWAVRFLDFLFQPAQNKLFAETFNVIPNTKEAFSYIKELFDTPEERISQLGQVTFSYGFYELIHPVIVDISKANNPKYMQDDGTGNLTLYPLDHFMEEMETLFQEQ